VSGVGTYKTTFNLVNWPSDAGAMLEIPSFLGSFRLTVNGQKLPPADQLAVEFDIGPWLHAGVNSLRLKLPQLLRITEPDVYAIATRQPFGLVGPVRIVSYREEVISQ
jgi:hypothetical protein